MFYQNKINFLKELQTSDGITKIEKFKSQINLKYSTLIYFFVIFISMYLILSKFLFYSFFTFLLLNFFGIFLRNLLFSKFVNLFIKYCQIIVNFEDYSKCIIKIISKKDNKSSEYLIENCFQLIITKYKEFLNDNNKVDLDNITKINLYRSYKYKSFSLIFDKFEEIFMTLENNKKLNFIFIFEYFKLFRFFNKLDEITILMKELLKKLKSEFESTEKDNNNLSNDVVDKIINTINSSNSSSILIDQILNLYLNNKKYEDEYLSLIKLIQSSREKEIIIEKFDSILESKYNLTNTIKQIKFNFNNQFLYLEENKIKENLTTKESNENIEIINDKKGVSLFDIELPIKNNSYENKNINNNNNFPTFSHYELMKRVEESKHLQMNLLFDLEEFQKIKMDNDEMNKEGIILENVLNDN